LLEGFRTVHIGYLKATRFEIEDQLGVLANVICTRSAFGGTPTCLELSALLFGGARETLEIHGKHVGPGYIHDGHLCDSSKFIAVESAVMGDGIKD
jgi:hypothetical protein